MGTKRVRRARAALGFIAKPLVLAIALTVLVRMHRSGGSFTEKVPAAAAFAQTSITKIAQTGDNMIPPAAEQESTSAPFDQDEQIEPDEADAADGADGADGIVLAAANLTRALVVVSTRQTPAEDTAWLADVPAAWMRDDDDDDNGHDGVFHYVTDAPLAADVAVPANKGREAMAYLTYIIDHYEALADVVVFHHAHRRAWHQPMDVLAELRALRVGYVARRGYVPLRCLSGCENVIALADYAVDDPAQLARADRAVQLTTLLGDVLGDDSVPRRLAAPCCAQFAASRAAIRRRSRAWWTALRAWLLATPLSDAASGRLMEYTWHLWLGSESVLCPEKEACLCHVFGIGDCDAYFALEADM